MVGGGVGGWRVHKVGAYTHPPMNSYNVKIFNFMNTHPPTHQTYPKCHSVTIHILWRVHGVGGGGVVGVFMRWVVVSLYYCTYTHPHMNSYDVIIFHFMNTHPPIKHIQSVTLSLYICFGGFMGWVVVESVVGGFMALVGVWWCG